MAKQKSEATAARKHKRQKRKDAEGELQVKRQEMDKAKVNGAAYLGIELQ